MQNDRFDAIPIPAKLDIAVKDGILNGIRQQKKLQRKKRFLPFSMSAAAVLCISIFLTSNPVLAAKIPFIGRIFTLVQDKITYKGNFNENAEILTEEPISKPEKSTESDRIAAGSLLSQTSNGLTVTISESNCSAQALYLAICIENDEPFPADFIKTQNMEGYIPDYDLLSMKSISYYSIKGLDKETRTTQGAFGPYHIEGKFMDDYTFAGIIRISLDEDRMGATDMTGLPDEFTYYLEISDIYSDLLEYKDVTLTDENGNDFTIKKAMEKHYEGSWNFAIDIHKNHDNQTIEVNQTNTDGIGISKIEKTSFEIKADIILPPDANPADYIVVICDANGKRLDSQGNNAEVYSTYRRNTDTVFVYVCDYIQYMDELKGDDNKISENALFQSEISFLN